MPELRNAQLRRGAGVETLRDLFLDRIDPQRGNTQVGEFIQMLGQPLQVATMKTAGIAAFYTTIIRAISIGESINEHEIHYVIRPVCFRRRKDRKKNNAQQERKRERNRVKAEKACSEIHFRNV